MKQTVMRGVLCGLVSTALGESRQEGKCWRYALVTLRELGMGHPSSFSHSLEQKLERGINHALVVHTVLPFPPQS